MRRVSIAVAVLACSLPAQAAKVDQVQRWVADGKCAEAVKKVDEWEDKDAFGTEDYELRRIRAQAGFCVAKGVDNVEGWLAFVKRFGDWPEAKDARTRLWDLALAAAQLEGTAAVMRGYIADYPDSPHLPQARAQEEAWAFEDAAKSGDPNAIHAFLAAHPNTTMREQAWETLVNTKEGIYLITAGGEPQKIEPLPIAGTDGIDVPAGLAVSGAFPTIGVNQPGAGRGETSEWWRLEAIAYDSTGTPHLTDIAPLAAVLADRLGAANPPPTAGLLDVTRAPGAHLARVAVTRNPLAAAKHCTGFTRMALTLRSPGTQAVAFPFAVDCPMEDETSSPLGLLLGAMDAAEAGNRSLAAQRWDTLVGKADAEGLVAWLVGALGEEQARVAVVDRPGTGDWVIWTQEGNATPNAVWLRPDGDAARVVATRPGWAIATPEGLRQSTNDPRCAAPLGSLGSTLFCTLGTAPALVAVQGEPVGWDLPTAEVFAAAGIDPAPELDQVLSVTLRWQGGMKGVWTVKKGKGTVEVVADAPMAWTRAATVPPPIAAWLEANAVGKTVGISMVGSNAWQAWGEFHK